MIISTARLLFFILIACASSHVMGETSNKPTNHNKHNHEHTGQLANHESVKNQLGENKHFVMFLFCNESPIPMSKIHDWTLHLETPDGKIVENAKVFIFGGMPMHNHEFPTIPRVKEYLGNGDYRVEGIKFSMLGHWEMHFSVDKNGKQDRAIFEIHL